MQTQVNEGTSSERPTPRPWGIVFGLSRADLQHEWILTLCLIMAIAAVLSPLLLLFGLKYGTIETLRYRLVQDPRNRVIKPLTSRSFSKEWFEQLRGRPEVGFLIPTTRQISATMSVAVEGKLSKAELDIIPTSEHDPLILENGGGLPASGECVLSHFAAEELDAKPGDTILATAKRIKDGQYESGQMKLRVAGVLSLRASDLKSMYVRLDVLEAVERYKDGQAVPEYGWQGAAPVAYPQYDGLVVALPQKLSPVDAFGLRNNTGFSKIEELTPEALQHTTGLRIKGDVILYLLSTQKKMVGQQSIETVRHKLRGKSATLMPWVAPLDAELLDASGNSIAALSLHALSMDTQATEGFQVEPATPWAGDAMARELILPAGLSIPEQGLQLRISNNQDILSFPVTPVARYAEREGHAFIPVRLAGILNLSKQRQLSYDSELKTFVLARRGYAGFRLYARTIDDVNALRLHFENTEGIPVHTEAQRIKDVKDLDRYLTLLFWFIAAVGVLGGTTALIASLYASVERKKRELGVLRLIGLSRAALFRYPIYQGVLIGIGGFIVAIVFFQSMATAINRFFAAHLGAGESFCKLPLTHASGALLATILIAILAASWASGRVMRIEPAEALRDE